MSEEYEKRLRENEIMAAQISKRIFHVKAVTKACEENVWLGQSFYPSTFMARIDATDESILINVFCDEDKTDLVNGYIIGTATALFQDAFVTLDKKTIFVTQKI